MYKIIGICVMVLLVLGACKRADVPTPLLEDIYKPYKLLESLRIENDTADFADGKSVVFKAKFTTFLDWKLTIRGDFSKNVRIISGKSNELNAINCTWNGKADRLPSFGPEACTAVLSFPNVDSLKNDSIVYRFRVKNLAPEPSFIRIASFDFKRETGLFKELGFGSGYGADTPNDNPKGLRESTAILTQAYGGTCFEMTGKDINSNWYIGGVNISAKNMNPNDTLFFPIKTQSAGNVYFNVWVYGHGNSKMFFEMAFNETDINQPRNTGETYNYQVIVSWTGWQLLSFPLSSCTRVNPGAGYQGNSFQEVNRITNVTLKALSYGAQKDVEVKLTIDNPTFTLGAPLRY